jgi:hypothetical protein
MDTRDPLTFLRAAVPPGGTMARPSSSVVRYGGWIGASPPAEGERNLSWATE